MGPSHIWRHLKVIFDTEDGFRTEHILTPLPEQQRNT